MSDAHETARRSAEVMLADDAASKGLGMELEHVAPGESRVSMVVRSDMVNGHALCHGGLIATLADTAFAVACNTHGTVTVAAGFEVDFLESAREGDRLVATCVERARRGRSGIYDVTVLRDDAEGTVIAEFRGRSRSLGTPIGRTS